MRRRRKERRKLILAGLAPLLAGAAWWLGRSVFRRSTHERAYSRPLSRPLPPRTYGLDQPPDLSPGEIGLSHLSASAQPGMQVPVTAPKGGRKQPAAAVQHRRGQAKIYDAVPPPSSRRRDEPAAVKNRSFPWLMALIPLLILAVLTAYSLIGRRPARTQVVAVPGGSVENGRRVIQSWGCGSCHTIPGIPGAYGKVGPELDQMAEQTYIAGMLPNTPENLIRWIMDPQEIQPGNAMPDTQVTEGTARDMAAYLYSIRSSTR